MLRHIHVYCLIALFAIFATACEKSGDSNKTKASGALSDDEKALFEHLPGDGFLVMGGHYSEEFGEYWEGSPLRELGELAASQSPSASDGMREYMTCWVDDGGTSKLAASMHSGTAGFTMNLVIDGVEKELLSQCAEEGGFDFHQDDDGKYVELRDLPDGMGGTVDAGYYYVDDGTAFTSFDVGLAGAASGISREELEARLDEASSSPASESEDILAMVKKADRSRAFWMAAEADGTPLAQAFDSGHGWVDVDESSMTFAFSIDLQDAATASRAVESYNEIGDSLAMLPADLKEAAEMILDDSELSSSGKTLEGLFVLENEALEKAVPALKNLGGGF